MERHRRALIGWALVAVIVLAAVLTLSPLPLQDLASTAIDRVLDVLHSWGVPPRVDRHVLELGANIVMFVPLGLLAALLLPRRRWWVALVGALLASVAVEAVQSAALPHRFGSLRDVLGNTLGAAIGIGLVAARRAAEDRADRPGDG
ncbi:MAG TPA: VanZ family protein [Cellulomonas sp.]|uniref:VanZ family protein n=1 Tax=Cellulomonas sp. TaxID=40001 RepID=UPI002E30DDD8|nr:VanZ family protein [Cellulomonas sp.]HEX5331218.1 VanZ family protein [Cellulomonas sp.]